MSSEHSIQIKTEDFIKISSETRSKLIKELAAINPTQIKDLLPLVPWYNGYFEKMGYRYISDRHEMNTIVLEAVLKNPEESSLEDLKRVMEGLSGPLNEEGVIKDEKWKGDENAKHWGFAIEKTIILLGGQCEWIRQRQREWGDAQGEQARDWHHKIQEAKTQAELVRKKLKMLMESPLVWESSGRSWRDWNSVLGDGGSIEARWNGENMERVKEAFEDIGLKEPMSVGQYWGKCNTTILLWLLKKECPELWQTWIHRPSIQGQWQRFFLEWRGHINEDAIYKVSQSVGDLERKTKEATLREKTYNRERALNGTDNEQQSTQLNDSSEVVRFLVPSWLPEGATLKWLQWGWKECQEMMKKSEPVTWIEKVCIPDKVLDRSASGPKKWKKEGFLKDAHREGELGGWMMKENFKRLDWVLSLMKGSLAKRSDVIIENWNEVLGAVNYWLKESERTHKGVQHISLFRRWVNAKAPCGLIGGGGNIELRLANVAGGRAWNEWAIAVLMAEVSEIGALIQKKFPDVNWTKPYWEEEGVMLRWVQEGAMQWKYGLKNDLYEGTLWDSNKGILSSQKPIREAFLDWILQERGPLGREQGALSQTEKWEMLWRGRWDKTTGPRQTVENDLPLRVWTGLTQEIWKKEWDEEMAGFKAALTAEHFLQSVDTEREGLDPTLMMRACVHPGLFEACVERAEELGVLDEALSQKAWVLTGGSSRKKGDVLSFALTENHEECVEIVLKKRPNWNLKVTKEVAKSLSEKGDRLNTKNGALSRLERLLMTKALEVADQQVDKLTPEPQEPEVEIRKATRRL